MNPSSPVASPSAVASLDSPPPGLDRFEYLEVGGDMALLRLALPGSWVDDQPSALRLTVTTGERCVGLAPLPGADGEGVATREVDGALQAGFSVPMELIRDPQAEFAVSVDEHPPRELPRPTVREPGPSVWRNTEGDLTPR